MTDPDLIERLAREANVWPDFAITQRHWRRFAALVAAECLAGVDEYLEAAAVSSMSRNNSEALATELLEHVKTIRAKFKEST